MSFCDHFNWHKHLQAYLAIHEINKLQHIHQHLILFFLFPFQPLIWFNLEPFLNSLKSTYRSHFRRFNLEYVLKQYLPYVSCQVLYFSQTLSSLDQVVHNNLFFYNAISSNRFSYNKNICDPILCLML